MGSTANKSRCVDCGISAPDTNTPHTLISQTHRWRLTRKSKADGTFVIEWRCPKCWKAHKERLEP